MDVNGDGVWNLTEVTNFIKAYAEHLQRNLSEGWYQKLETAFNEVNNGVSMSELMKAVGGDKFPDFKTFIIDHSHELPRGALDRLYLLDLVM